MTADNGQIEAEPDPGVGSSTGWLSDLRHCLMFLTRLPVTTFVADAHRPLANAVRGFPLVGVLVGALSGLVLLPLSGLSPTVAALIAVIAMTLITGGLHEDGLADVADGFGAQGDRERKLEIMRDSRIGTYGVLVLMFCLGLKTAALSVLIMKSGTIWQVPLVLMAVGALSRTWMAVMMAALPSARSNGRSFDAGTPPLNRLRQAVAIGIAISFLLIWSGYGLVASALAVLLSAAAYYLLKRMSFRQIGGQTGDVIGATQQITEIASLIGILLIVR